uniref:Uncharacterized protein n=1 Tax=viral metagenome TaxID=1070528 RepID=A0A6M3JXQ2_9ZZZZ
MPLLQAIALVMPNTPQGRSSAYKLTLDPKYLDTPNQPNQSETSKVENNNPGYGVSKGKKKQMVERTKTNYTSPLGFATEANVSKKTLLGQ